MPKYCYTDMGGASYDYVADPIYLVVEGVPAEDPLPKEVSLIEGQEYCTKKGDKVLVGTFIRHFNQLWLNFGETYGRVVRWLDLDSWRVCFYLPEPQELGKSRSTIIDPKILQLKSTKVDQPVG